MVKNILHKRGIVFRIIILAVALMVGFASARLIFSKKENVKATVAQNKENIIRNYLFLGVDNAANLSDVIMLASINTETQKISVAQIPRDTYAEYTSAAYRKLNGALSALGGGREVADFFEEIFKIKIDGYVKLNLDTLADVVDLIGGVEVNIPENMVYEDIYQDLSIELKSGKQLLDGEKAKQFIRFRSGYTRGDIARLDAQKIFLSALFEKLKSCSVPELIKPVQKLITDSKSDITFGECLKLVPYATKIKETEVSFVTMPGADIISDGGTSYYVLNKKETYRVLREHFNCQSEYSEIDGERALTGTYSKEFNEIYDAQSGYEYKVYTAHSINSDGIEIERIK